VGYNQLNSRAGFEPRRLFKYCKGDARPLWKPDNFVPASRGGVYLESTVEFTAAHEKITLGAGTDVFALQVDHFAVADGAEVPPVCFLLCFHQKRFRFAFQAHLPVDDALSAFKLHFDVDPVVDKFSSTDKKFSGWVMVQFDFFSAAVSKKDFSLRSK